MSMCTEFSAECVSLRKILPLTKSYKDVATFRSLQALNESLQECRNPASAWTPNRAYNSNPQCMSSTITPTPLRSLSGQQLLRCVAGRCPDDVKSSCHSVLAA